MAVSPTSGLARSRPVGHLALLKLLADGELHSGEWLAQRLGVSRTAVWKGIERLRTLGIDVEGVPRRGYALPWAVELLEDCAIRRVLSRERAARLRSLDVQFDVDSTNSRLLAAQPPPNGCADALLCELQRVGRGRRGRPWVTAFGGSIALSIAWSFVHAAEVSPALSLCAGVAVARALARAGAQGVLLKWPNDIWLGDRKMGGVLIELRAEAGGPAHVVIGVGVNAALAPQVRARIEAEGVRVAAVADASAVAPSRNVIAGAIIDELLSMLTQFEQDGFAGFREAWLAVDALRDRPVRVLVGTRVVAGTARGVDSQGALRLESEDGRRHEFVSGEVSLRLAGDDI